jgi:hypothetical protein
LEKFPVLENRFSLGEVLPPSFLNPGELPSPSLLNPELGFFLNGLSASGFAPNDGRLSPRGFSLSNREDENLEGPENLPLPDRSEDSPLVSFFRSRKDFSAPVLLPNDVFLFPAGFPVRAIILSSVNEGNVMIDDKKIVLTVPSGRS